MIVIVVHSIKEVITVVNGISIVHMFFENFSLDWKRSSVVPWRVWPNRYYDGCHLESQEGLETKVGLRADLVGAPGSVSWFHVNGECNSYGIERS
ncbi:hypothetical protein M9H77_34920 [Catharanthus roseus]|uniref:Uncharacterized protein n=1 Tax=Catharanthus roseus TaxID=4058 RepID=A0ACB9ZNA2_CATRO|nr:hypothetical protein M9H77_34920 [Catharanthus roseus]